MSKEGRNLQPGDFALIDWDCDGRFKKVRIIERFEGPGSQSGVMFKVAPPPRLCTRDSKLDSYWFEPMPEERSV